MSAVICLNENQEYNFILMMNNNNYFIVSQISMAQSAA